MHDLVERQAVDEDQVIARPAASHREVGKVSGRNQARQAVQSAHHVTAGTDGTAKLFAVSVRVAGRAVDVCPDGARQNGDLVDSLLRRHELDAERRRATSDDANAGFETGPEARAGDT